METKKTKKFEFDEDTYNIEFKFSGNDMKNYKIVIHANYQNDDYIELYQVDENEEVHLLNRFTNNGMNSLWESMYNLHTQDILIKICNLVKDFMKVRRN